MAKFIELKCRKCGNAFTFYAGQTKRFYEFNEKEREDAERKAELYNRNLFDAIKEHNLSCDGGLVLESEGYAD
jgi:hypothetical protein